MTDLVVIVPSRERPESARAVAAAFEATCTADTRLVFAVDDNDPTRHLYPEWTGLYRTQVFPSRNMGEALNRAAWAVAWTEPPFGQDSPFAVAFMGDDHLPRTVGWDQAYLDALRELGTGLVYGNDLLQGRGLPTQVALTSDIVRALGFMAPPALTHLFVDNFWLSLGNEAGCIRYLPDVIVEHRHPAAGKAALDAGYERVNSVAMQSRDEAAWLAYLESDFAADVEKVKALRERRAADELTALSQELGIV